MCFHVHSPLPYPSMGVLSACCKSSCRALCPWSSFAAALVSDRAGADSLNPNLGRQGRDSEQKLSCVSQLPSYQSQDLISFLKGPIVSSKDCEIVPCGVAVNGRAAGPAGMALPEQLTAVQRVADVRLWHPLLPPGPRRGSCFLSLHEPPQDKSLSRLNNRHFSSRWSGNFCVTFTQVIPKRNVRISWRGFIKYCIL